MICKGKDCKNEVEKGWCKLCQLRWACKEYGYKIYGELKEGEIYGLILQREDLK